MKKILLLLLLTFCVLSCAKAQSLGVGISVDAQGNLKIDAPLYVIDKTGEKPILKLAPSTMNYEVDAVIPYGDNFYSMEVTGGIVKDRLSLTIKKPEENYLHNVATLWNIPEDLFTSGAEAEIGQLLLLVKNENYAPIYFYPDKNVQVLTENNNEKVYYYIQDARYEYIYSLGEIKISGNFHTSMWGDWKYHQNFDIYIKQGWNVILSKEYFDDSLKDDIFNKTTSFPTIEAVWVIVE